MFFEVVHINHICLWHQNQLKCLNFAERIWCYSKTVDLRVIPSIVFNSCKDVTKKRTVFIAKNSVSFLRLCLSLKFTMVALKLSGFGIYLVVGTAREVRVMAAIEVAAEVVVVVEMELVFITHVWQTGLVELSWRLSQ